MSLEPGTTKAAEPSNKQPPEQQKLRYEDTITFLLGSDEKPFIVHEAILRHSSPRVADFVCGIALNALDEAAQTKTMRLSHRSSTDFDAYVHWVYTGEMDIPRITDALMPRQMVRLVCLGELAESLRDFACCNKIIDFFLEQYQQKKITKEHLNHDVLCVIGGRCSSHDSMLRRLFCDMAAELRAGKLSDLPCWIRDTMAERFVAREWFAGILDEEGELKPSAYYHYRIFDTEEIDDGPCKEEEEEEMAEDDVSSEGGSVEAEE